MEDLANTAAVANASGGTAFGFTKAAHMDTAAYGLHAIRKPMHTTTESWAEKEQQTDISNEDTHEISET